MQNLQKIELLTEVLKVLNRDEDEKERKVVRELLLTQLKVMTY